MVARSPAARLDLATARPAPTPTPAAITMPPLRGRAVWFAASPKPHQTDQFHYYSVITGMRDCRQLIDHNKSAVDPAVSHRRGRSATGRPNGNHTVLLCEMPRPTEVFRPLPAAACRLGSIEMCFNTNGTPKSPAKSIKVPCSLINCVLRDLFDIV